MNGPRQPLSWNRWSEHVYRACKVCVHGRDAEGRPVRGSDRTVTQCASPEAAGRGRLIPVIQARANGGACGPEAHLQDFPGLHLGCRRAA